MVTNRFWADFTSTALSAFNEATHNAQLSEKDNLPIYAIVNGKLHKFEGYGPEHKQALQHPDYGEVRPGTSDYVDVLAENKSFVEHAGGAGKSLPGRLSSMIRLNPDPTPLKKAIDYTPTLSAEDKVSMALSVVPAFKDDHKGIPLRAALQLAQHEGFDHFSVEVNGILSVNKMPFLQSHLYHSNTDSFSNLSVYPIGDTLKAVQGVEHFNKTMLSLMHEQGDAAARIVPQFVQALGFGLPEHGEQGFSEHYRLSPTSQALFQVTKDRIQKYGHDGVIFVNPNLVTPANESANAQLQKHVEIEWGKIQSRNKDAEITRNLLKPRQFEPRLTEPVAPAPAVPSPPIETRPPAIETKIGGRIAMGAAGWAIGPAIGVWSNMAQAGANGANLSQAAYSGLKNSALDLISPGLSNGYQGLRQGGKIDRLLNAAQTATGTIATAGFALAPVTGGWTLPFAAIAGVATLAIGLVQDAAHAVGLSQTGGPVTGIANAIENTDRWMQKAKGKPSRNLLRNMEHTPVATSSLRSSPTENTTSPRRAGPRSAFVPQM